uniref:Uncharacterized protein n=1 Tax=Ditylenchus dipsaci TaxID=166011 RepID=A0A915D3Z5_9BILA
MRQISLRCRNLKNLEVWSVEGDWSFSSESINLLLSGLPCLQKLIIVGFVELEIGSVAHLQALIHFKIAFREFLTDKLLISISKCSQLKALDLCQARSDPRHLYSSNSLQALANLRLLEDLKLVNICYLTDELLISMTTNYSRLKQKRISIFEALSIGI